MSSPTDSMHPLDRLQDWYASRCDGEWEHGVGITIEGIDNPGWSITIALSGTGLENKPFRKIKRGHAAYDFEDWQAGGEWIEAAKVKLENVYPVFRVFCSPRSLNEAVTIFLQWAGTTNTGRVKTASGRQRRARQRTATPLRTPHPRA